MPRLVFICALVLVFPPPSTGATSSHGGVLLPAHNWRSDVERMRGVSAGAVAVIHNKCQKLCVLLLKARHDVHYGRAGSGPRQIVRVDDMRALCQQVMRFGDQILREAGAGAGEGVPLLADIRTEVREQARRYLDALHENQMSHLNECVAATCCVFCTCVCSPPGAVAGCSDKSDGNTPKLHPLSSPSPIT